MLKTVATISKKIENHIGFGKYATLENIKASIEAYTHIDKIVFIEYPSLPSNPIWGQFRKFVQTPNAYTSVETRVEVYYASHLNNVWKRFVVCKELCHSLDVDVETYSASTRSINNLVNIFALSSAQKSIRESRAYDAEILAELGAIELLCPMEYRNKLILNGDFDCEKECAKFGIPFEYGNFCFSEESIKIAKILIEND